jgi:signal transduction histidine kinase
MIDKWTLRSISIKTRLRLFFGGVVLLVLLGSILSYWQFRNVSDYATLVAQTERRFTALLRLNDSLLTAMSRLHRAAEYHDAALFEREANRLIKNFQQAIADSKPALEEIARESDLHAVLASSIQTNLDNFPTRVSAFVRLAQSEDWVALHARLLNQTDTTDEVVAALMNQIDRDLVTARQRLIEDLRRAQQRAVNVLVVSGILSFAAAVILGTVVTRTITTPLADLDRATAALAAGGFQHRVPVDGKDDLTHLAMAFNRTAAELERLFDEVRHQRANAEAAHAELNQRAQELARANADLQQFAYSASHDLQEPLRVVALYAQLLHRKYLSQLDTSGEEYIGYILRGTRQLEQLIRDLLAYTQTSVAGKTVEASTDVNVVLHRVLGLLEVQIREQNGTVIADSLPVVRAQEVHVQQLLQNLIANAIRYRSELPPEIKISAERRQERWEFSVRDNGQGIDPQYATQIFGIFKRLHGQEYPGTGIGLAICQKIVEGYGGRIWVESEVGKGANFRFTLPAA